MLCLGLKDEATRLLLETEPSNENFYSDHLLACLVASTEVAESGTPHSTTKLVATNLIAEGKLWQGVQLLCLINKVHITFSVVDSPKAPSVKDRTRWNYSSLEDPLDIHERD